MSESFDVSWLALREPVDHRARSEPLTRRLAVWWSERGARRALDLGSGTGSNVRYLAPRLAGPQEWTLVDHDAELLGVARASLPGVQLETVIGDLASEGPPRAGDADLVTASALLDLVSERWLRALVDACAAADSAALLALTYDGTVAWPGTEQDGESDPVDALVLEAVNAHQTRDKGLGPALGPAGATRAEALFGERGYDTWLAPSPWRLGPDDSTLAQALVDGWLLAATEMRPDQAGAIREWAARRRTAIAHGDLRLLVGHQDLLVLPEGCGPGGRGR